MDQANEWTGPVKLPAPSWGFLILNKSFWHVFSVCGYVYKWCACGVCACVYVGTRACVQGDERRVLVVICHLVMDA